MRYFNLRLFLLLLLTAAGVQAQEPASADDFSQRAINRFEKNDLEGAIADFTKAIELKAQQQEFCFYFRGLALYRRGRLDEAIADITKAIALKQHPRFYGDRGNMLAQKGDLEGAIADLNKAIEIEPKFAKAYGDRGIVHLMRGEDNAAESDFTKCFELDKTLETQFKSAAHSIKQQSVLRTEHQTAADVEIVKFSWDEETARELKPSQPVATVTTTPVSQSGLRVLGNPTAKDQPGPPPLLDPIGTPLPSHRSKSDTVIRGVNYKFSALIRNTGSKTITNVHWAYLLVPTEPNEAFAYVFTTKINIPPGKEKTLRDVLPSRILPTAQSKYPSTKNREQFKERVVILRLEYSDGSTWKSSTVRR